MIYEAEIEDGEEYIYVDIDFDLEWDDGSFSYSYGNISAVHSPGGTFEIVGEKWARSLYSDRENEVIGKWVSDNIDFIYKELNKLV